jgi:hypothetical protein
VLAALAMGVALFGSAQARATPPPLEYSGGPILRSFTIYPLYYGNWTSSEIAAQQSFLQGLAGYISGQGAPAGQQPMTKQYGVHNATVALAFTWKPTAQPTALSDDNIRSIISQAQDAGFHGYGDEVLLMVFPAHNFTVTEPLPQCAYHGNVAVRHYYAAVPEDCKPTLPLVTAHEVFEAATDPCDFTGSKAWQEPSGNEAIDPCGTTVTLPFGQIPGAVSDARGGECSATGFTRQLTVTQVGTTANVSANWMVLDDPQLNNNPNALAVVTPNWSGGVNGVGEYLNHPIGVFWSANDQRWYVFNEDVGAMPPGVAFNVRINPCGASSDASCPAFIHTATSANTSSNETWIDDPRTNDNPSLSLLVTANATAGSIPFAFVDGLLEVGYDPMRNKWAVFTTSPSLMPVGAAFNVYVEAATDVTADSSNTISNSVYIDAPLANGHPDARVVVTQRGGDSANVGVWYDTNLSQWAIFNQDLSPMPIGATFNFLVE